MVGVVDRVVVKKVIHVFLKQVNLWRLSVQLKMDKSKKTAAWVLFYLVLNEMKYPYFHLI